jgi:hypothetical protein
VPIRKFSTDTPSVLTDMAAISSLNLKRNGSGSMAHLLEQQHILRREFTATPATNGGSSSDGHGQLQSSNSNSSSLSPSIEQVCWHLGRKKRESSMWRVINVGGLTISGEFGTKFGDLSETDIPGYLTLPWGEFVVAAGGRQRNEERAATHRQLPFHCTFYI